MLPAHIALPLAGSFGHRPGRGLSAQVWMPQTADPERSSGKPQGGRGKLT